MSDAGVNQYNMEPPVERDQVMVDATEDSDEREMEEVDRALEDDQVEETRQRAWVLVHSGRVSIQYSFSLLSFTSKPLIPTSNSMMIWLDPRLPSISHPAILMYISRCHNRILTLGPMCVLFGLQATFIDKSTLARNSSISTSHQTNMPLPTLTPMSVPLSHQCIHLLTCFPSTDSHLAVLMPISNHRKTLISRPMYVRS